MKKVNSKFSIRFFFSLITITFLWLTYFVFFIGNQGVPLSTKIVFVFLVLGLIKVCIKTFSLCIKIEDGYLKINGMNMSNATQGISRAVGVFPIKDIDFIKVDYIKKEGRHDMYLGKGKPMLFVKTKDGEFLIPLQSFNPKKVEEFIKLNFISQ